MSRSGNGIKGMEQSLFRFIKNNYKRGLGKIGEIGITLIKMSIVVGISFIILAPLFGIISKAIMSIDDYYNPLVYLIPENFTFYNIKTAFENMQYINSLTLTCSLSLGVMIIQAFVCAIVGYGFARFKFPGRGILFGLVVLTIILPMQTMIVPMYIQFRYFNPFGIISLFTNAKNGINLINSVTPVLLMSLTGMGLRSGLYIFIYRQFFRGLPKGIEEAAVIDGAGSFRTFFQIMLPNAKSSSIIVMLFSFVWQYNDTFLSGLFMSGKGLLSLKLISLNSVLTQVLLIRDTNQVALILNAAVLLVIIPLLIIYLFMQRFFMEGIERSGIVG